MDEIEHLQQLKTLKEKELEEIKSILREKVFAEEKRMIVNWKP